MSLTFSANETVYCRFTGEAFTVVNCNGCVATLSDGTGRIVGELTRKSPIADEGSDDLAECLRCNGSGIIGLRTRTGSYVGPGPVPEDARGVCESTCDECRGHGRVEAPAKLQPYISSAAKQFAPGNFVTTWNPDLGRDAVGVTRAIEDVQEANPRVLVKWLHDLSQEWVRSEYLDRTL